MESVTRFYGRHPVWSWVIIAFVGLLILGALVPASDESSNDKSSNEPVKQEQTQEQVEQDVAPAKTIKLTATTAARTTTRKIVVTGSVDPATADVSVGLDHPARVNAAGRFRGTLILGAHTGDYAPVVQASAPGYKDAETSLNVRYVLTAAEKQRRREARAQRREEARQRAEAENAIGSAQDYLDLAGFSRSGLIKQLEYEGYSTANATYAVDHVGADWNAEAVQSAQDYLDLQNFSQQGLSEQLAYEGYTPEQVQQAVAKVY
jgi:Host cell surface-exposed lipoprotein